MGNTIQCCFKRYEKKYILTADQYYEMQKGMLPYMRADKFSNYTICNVYYDTDSFSLIRSSLEKPVYKEKLRMRSYGVPGDGDKVFVELKKKYDKVVYKRRITMAAAEAVDYLNGKAPGDGSQISREIDWFMKSYRPSPKVYIRYDREAYAGIDEPELRITFDTNLKGRTTDVDLRKGDYGELILPEDLFLMEIKIPGTTPLWLAELLNENSIYSTSFSKYGSYYKKFVLPKQSFPVPESLPQREKSKAAPRPLPTLEKRRGLIGAGANI